MVYLLSQFISITPNTVGLVFIAEFLALVLYTHWMVSRHRVRQNPEFQELYLAVDNT
jgi:isopenicillin N synthase-like dioxygenase